jgi:cytidylate kinase
VDFVVLPVVAYGAVCISSEDGAGAGEAARLVADRLGFRLIDEEIVARAAVEAGVDHDVVADVERRKSALVRLLEGLGPASMGTGFAFLPPETIAEGPPPSDELRTLIKAVIEDIATAGDVVIVAHAASITLATRDDVLRVLVTASGPTRRRRLAASLRVDEKEAARVMKRSDAGRADYIKRFYGIGAERPTHYDLVINTDKLTPDDAARVIVDVVDGAACGIGTSRT